MGASSRSSDRERRNCASLQVRHPHLSTQPFGFLPLFLCVAVPFLLPNIGSFRVITGTVGVDYYSLNYSDYCDGQGLMKFLARQLDSFGIDPRTEEAIVPNAPILRTAEAVDAVTNVLQSARQTDNTKAAGYLICSVCQVSYALPNPNL